MPTQEPTTEIWKPITDFERLYDVSNLGRVRRLKGTGTGFPKSRTYPYILKPLPHTGGYLQVSLWKEGKQYRRFIHLLVAREFLGECPPGKEVNHINCDVTDARAENLEYIEHLGNVRHSINSGRWVNKWAGRHKLSNADVLEIRRLWASREFSQGEIGAKFGVRQSCVSRIVTGLARVHMDYYKE